MDQEINLRAMNTAQFRTAKRLWSVALALKLGIFGLGIWAAVRSSIYVPQLALLLAIASEGVQLASDTAKAKGEALLRLLDLCLSFGRPISRADKRDIVAAAPKALRERANVAELTDFYFDSSENPGPRRAIENLLESAWYTKHQMERMAWVYGVATSGILLIATGALLITAREVAAAATREEVVRMVTSLLLVLVSLSMLKNVWAHIRMYNRCARTEAACSHLLKALVTESDAQQQWAEYHVARAGAPLVPQWVWLSMRTQLAESWALTRPQQGVGSR